MCTPIRTHVRRHKNTLHSSVQASETTLEKTLLIICIVMTDAVCGTVSLTKVGGWGGGGCQRTVWMKRVVKLNVQVACCKLSRNRMKMLLCQFSLAFFIRTHSSTWCMCCWYVQYFPSNRPFCNDSSKLEHPSPDHSWIKLYWEHSGGWVLCKYVTVRMVLPPVQSFCIG